MTPQAQPWGPLPSVSMTTRQHFLHNNTMYLVFEFGGYLCVYLFYTVSPHHVLCPSREPICGKQLKKKNHFNE